MKAIVKTRPEYGIEVRDVEKPVVGENDILIRILVPRGLAGLGWGGPAVIEVVTDQWESPIMGQ